MARQLSLLQRPVRRVRLTTWDLLQNRLPLEDILRQKGIDPDQPYHREQDAEGKALIVTQELRRSSA